MTDRLTIALAQINPAVGDIDGNADRILATREEAAGADLVVYSELVLCGYPPEDLVLKPFFQDKVEQAVGRLAKATSDGGAALLIGAPWQSEDRLHNAVLLLDQGSIASVRFKYDLPNYSVFDEKRVFQPGPMPGPSNFRDVRLGVPIYEDIWTPEVPECLEDAAEVARLLGTQLDDISIGPAIEAFGTMLQPIFEDRPSDFTEENIQARNRGLILMAMSNKLGHMLLTTGNKSEMSVGYATLYGDMCGGISVLKDVYKMDVFALCKWRNQNYPDGVLGPDGRVMPERVITKPPSAELRPDQKDQDSLPEYEVLDDILQCLIEREMSIAEIESRGHDAETIQSVWRMLDLTEYKRRQAPPGVKLTGRAFGRDRRYPITNSFRRII